MLVSLWSYLISHHFHNLLTCKDELPHAFRQRSLCLKKNHKDRLVFKQTNPPQVPGKKKLARQIDNIWKTAYPRAPYAHLRHSINTLLYKSNTQSTAQDHQWDAVLATRLLLFSSCAQQFYSKWMHKRRSPS